ncbi:BolA family transcriptional regulator [Amaricoccus sp.]|uniref:BolA family protein n=1 Tax=Amaricoccus sp. TaxID=1872485 RepID=UPI001B71C630|nr:BolA family protein [Amaricoccus sp.]MBP7002102.1 BolA family transcriptional regulator [Amaricoccus sp.]
MAEPPYSTKSVHAKLSARFAPDFLKVIDESESHRGHGGWREGGNTHYRVVMRSAAFDGLSRIERARAVHAALREELASGLHALALELSGESDGYDDGLVGGPEPGGRA